MQDRAENQTGLPQVDDALAQVSFPIFDQLRTWTREARNLQPLTIYEQRIQRKVDKNTLQLKTLQTERKEAAREAMRRAKLLYQLAQAGGKPYQLEACFVTAPEVRESVFSTSEIAAALSREKLLNDAKYYDRRGELPATGQGPTATGQHTQLTIQHPPLASVMIKRSPYE
jgi:hypothetical protein